MELIPVIESWGGNHKKCSSIVVSSFGDAKLELMMTSLFLWMYFLCLKSVWNSCKYDFFFFWLVMTLCCLVFFYVFFFPILTKTKENIIDKTKFYALEMKMLLMQLSCIVFWRVVSLENIQNRSKNSLI